METKKDKTYKTYEERQKEEIYFKVNGENEINKIISHVTPLLNEYFKGLIGESILKSGYSVTYGELFKKHKDKVNTILQNATDTLKTNDISPNMYLTVDTYSIHLNIKLRFNNYDGFVYYDGYKYIVNLENGKVKSLYDFTPTETLKPEEQYKIFCNCLDLKIKLEEEKKKLKPYALRENIK